MYIKYLWYVIRHKWFVFVECVKLGVPWLGLIHDLSKFLPREFIPYARNFYGTYPKDLRYTRFTAEGVKAAFDVAWLHHQKGNRHHWQYWLLQYDQGEAWKATRIEGDLYRLDDYVSTGLDYGVTQNIDGSVDVLVDKLNLAPVALEMPDRYRREMLADWRGAGRAILGKSADTKAWYEKQKRFIILHPETRKWIEAHL